MEGFSLLEMLVALAIVSLCTLALTKLQLTTLEFSVLIDQHLQAWLSHV